MATPCSTRDPLLLGRWFQDEVIMVAVRWYLTNQLSYRQVCDMLCDRRVGGCEHRQLSGSPRPRCRFRTVLDGDGLGFRLPVRGQEFGSFHRTTRSQMLPDFPLRPGETFLYTCGPSICGKRSFDRWTSQRKRTARTCR
jgi:hypothetical protein